MLLPAAATAAAMLASACATRAPDKPATAPQLPGSTGVAQAPGGGYDWRPLVVVPFGTLLKQSSLPLHEVLLFHDTDGPPVHDGGDCFALDGTAPRFAGRKPDTYLLCFEHDRLVRIELTLRAGTADAAALLERSCTAWRKPAPGATGADSGACESREDGSTISARLTRDPGDGGALLSIAVAHPWLAP